MTKIHPVATRRRGRPPKAADEIDELRGRLLRAGVAILTEKGYSSTGLDEILRSVGVPKGSFYYYFPSKDAFGLELIASYASYFADKLDRWFTDTALTPLQRLRDFIADASRGMERHDFKRGCLVGNLGQEMGALPEIFRERLISVFEDWQARTAACLRAAQAAGEIAPDADCDALAAFFWIGWEGAVLRAKLERRAAPLDHFAAGFFNLLEKQSAGT